MCERTSDCALNDSIFGRSDCSMKAIALARKDDLTSMCEHSSFVLSSPVVFQICFIIVANNFIIIRKILDAVNNMLTLFKVNTTF